MKPIISNYITVASASKTVGSPESTIRGWLKRGLVKSRKVEGRVQVQRKSLLRKFADVRGE